MLSMVSLIRGVFYTACMCRHSIALRYFISVCDIKEYAAGVQLGELIVNYEG